MSTDVDETSCVPQQHAASLSTTIVEDGPFQEGNHQQIDDFGDDGGGFDDDYEDIGEQSGADTSEEAENPPELSPEDVLDEVFFAEFMSDLSTSNPLDASYKYPTISIMVL